PIGALARRLDRTTDRFEEELPAEADVIEEPPEEEADDVVDPLGAMLAYVLARQTSLAPGSAAAPSEAPPRLRSRPTPGPAPRRVVARGGGRATALGISLLVGIGLGGLLFLIGLGLAWMISR